MFSMAGVSLFLPFLPLLSKLTNMGSWLTGLAGHLAGGMSIAVGPVAIEKADLEKEKLELKNHPKNELDELTAIYVNRGLDQPLARPVVANGKSPSPRHPKKAK
jgi:hypothetical protein